MSSNAMFHRLTTRTSSVRCSTREMCCARLYPLEDVQVLTHEQDLNILVLPGSMTHPDEVKQQRERLREKKAKHADR